MEEIKSFIVQKLQENYKFPENTDINRLNYVKEGYVTSLGMIQFVVELEETFDIRFNDEELGSERFHIVGELIRLIESKVG